MRNFTYARLIQVLNCQFQSVLGKRLSVRVTEEIVENVMGEIRHQIIENGCRVSIPSFGVFYPKKQKARLVTSPVDQEKTCRVPYSVKVGFRAGKAAKKNL